MSIHHKSRISQFKSINREIETNRGIESKNRKHQQPGEHACSRCYRHHENLCRNLIIGNVKKKKKQSFSILETLFMS